MGKQTVTDRSSICPKSYTLLVQKQINCYGDTEFMIEIKELEGCVSYGKTFSEAKKGLNESVEVWFKHRRRTQHPVLPNTNIVYLEPVMTKEQFEDINQRLLHFLLN